MQIDLTQAKFEVVNAERIFKEIKIVPLETHKDALLNTKSVTYYLTDKYIIAVNFLQGAYLFNRETGKFVREISSFGQGPDEYTGYIYNRYGFDEKNNILFASDGAYVGKSWKGMHIETNKVGIIIKKPMPENDTETFSACAPWLIKDNTYISFCNNRTGKDKIRLVVFNKNGTILKKYPNYLEYKKEMSTYPANNGIFYYYNNLTYFKEWNYNDTVFCVDENKMTPHILFKSGDKQASYYHQDNATYNKGKYLINFVNESNSFVLFNFSYYQETIGNSGYQIIKNETPHTGFYDKKSLRTYVSSTPDFKTTGFAITGIPIYFYPLHINKNREMVAKIDPEELTKYKDNINPKYKYIFHNIQEDDNPIVVIAKIRE